MIQSKKRRQRKDKGTITRTGNDWRLTLAYSKSNNNYTRVHKTKLVSSQNTCIFANFFRNFAKSVNKVTLQFKDTDKEKAYAKVEDPSNGKSFFGLTCIVAATAAASALIISFQTVGFTSASLTIITVSVIGLWIMTGRSAFLGKMLARSVLTIVCVIVAVATNFSYLVKMCKLVNM